MKCNYCNNEYTKKGLSAHIRKAHYNEFSSKSEMENFIIKCVYFLSQKDIKSIIDDYKLESVLFLKNKYKLPYKVILRILEYNNVLIRDISESLLLDTAKNKRKNTNLDRFGVENVSQNNEIKRKKQETFITHYGVDNIFKFEKFKENINNIMLLKYGSKRLFNIDKRNLSNIDKYGSICPLCNIVVKEKKDKTCMEKYGTIHPSQSIDIKQKIKETIKNRSEGERKRISEKISKKQKEYWANLSDEEKYQRLQKIHKITCSNIESKIGELLNTYEISYIHNYYITSHNYTFQYDYVLCDLPIIIEVNGDFWHANPSVYKKDDELHFPNKIIKLAKQIWKKDLLKKNIAKHKGYTVIYLWEKEINNNSEEFLFELLLTRIEEALDACKNKIN